MSVQNSRKIILWRKIPSFESSFSAPYQKNLSRNSKSASFTELLTSLMDLQVLEETKQTWTMFSESKALDDSVKF